MILAATIFITVTALGLWVTVGVYLTRAWRYTAAGRASVYRTGAFAVAFTLLSVIRWLPPGLTGRLVIVVVVFALTALATLWYLLVLVRSANRELP